ncbi:hypothetical protein LOAG_05193 [Loa loa]|uniref:Uncharacterized protein n=1 Tax=Loa loa TaxID=7209 RepID=A0A1S0U111_LOALO|nr:hypothetical protein LOAG_05193 [Loa loa]EFO23297.2 hypothetical protein LOAG_05193 [Loa loa]
MRTISTKCSPTTPPESLLHGLRLFGESELSYAPLAINTVSSSSSSPTTTTATVGGRSGNCCIATHRSIVIMRLLLIVCVGLIIPSPYIASAQETPAEQAHENAVEDTKSSSVCHANEVFNGKTCECAPGYFMQSDKESKLRCEDECEEVYFTFFTYGACVSDIYGRLPKNAQSQCNLRCGVRIRTLASIGIFFNICCSTCNCYLHFTSLYYHMRIMLECTEGQQDSETSFY